LRNKFNAIKHHSIRLNFFRSCRWNHPPNHIEDKRKEAAKSKNWLRHALPRSFTRFLRFAKISPSAARNASFVLTALLRQLLTVLFHVVANHVANFAASDVASRDYHLVANPVLTVLLTTLRTLSLRMLPRVVTTLLLTVLPRRC
jgi:hypothetical protein